MICSNTTHASVPYFRDKLSIPLLHIADATADMLVSHQSKRVLFLGTKYTMNLNSHTCKPLRERGIEVVLPSEQDIEMVNWIIYEELCHNKVVNSSRDKYLEVIRKAHEQHAIDAVVLGCTEIPLLVTQSDLDAAGIPVMACDTTAIHIERAAKFAEEGE